MSTPSAPPSARRDTRVLLVTIAVSFAVLLLLSRFRFGGLGSGTDLTSRAPLERLAAAATYDELAAIIGGMEPQILKSIVTLGLEHPSPSAADTTYAPALRVRDDLAIGAIDPGADVVTIDGVAVTGGDILSVDGVRGLVAVRVPSSPAPTLSLASPAPAGARPRYVVAVEASRGGAALRPVFLGRTDLYDDSRWPEPILGLGAAGPFNPGALVFGLDARLVGLVVHELNGVSLIPGNVLMQVVDDLAQPRQGGPADLGIGVQALSDPLRQATGATSGVVVTSVAPGTSAAAALRPGDVVVAVDGRGVRSLAEWASEIARRLPGTKVRLDIVRDRQPTTVEAEMTDRGSFRRTRPTDLGLELTAIAGTGSEVRRAVPRLAGAAAGLRPGDLIVRAGAVLAPQPRDVSRAWAAVPASDVLLLIVERQGEALAIGVPKP